MPEVTIAIPFKNAEATLAVAIDSIRAQSFEDWHLYLIDDGSSDASLSIAREYACERITVFSDGKSQGVSARLNQAARTCTSSYFCRMDADDISLPSRLAVQLSYMRGNPHIDLCASSIALFSDDGTVGGMVAVSATHSDICAHPWRGFIFPHPTWLGKTSWFQKNPYLSHQDGAEDQALLYRARHAATLGGIPQILLAYRENKRSFRKLLGRRRAFLRATIEEAYKAGAWRDIVMVLMIQPAKIAGDFLNTKLGVRGARNRLQSVDIGIERELARLLSSRADGRT